MIRFGTNPGAAAAEGGGGGGALIVVPDTRQAWDAQTPNEKSLLFAALSDELHLDISESWITPFFIRFTIDGGGGR